MADTRHVIVIGVDGLRPDQVTPETMPNLAAMRARGVHSDAHRTVFPSETRGALTALANGARPATTGVLGNVFYARGTSKRLQRTDTIHDWRSAEETIVGGMVTSISLSETLAKHGHTLAVVNSSGQGSFTALNWKGAERGQVGFNVRHPHLSYPHVLAADIEDRHRVPATGFLRGAEQPAIDIFTKSVWPARKPSAAILWFSEVDSASHLYGLGAEGQLASMIQCDKAIGNLLDWRDAQPERDNTLIIVTSDHGHATTGESISIGETLKKAGISASSHFEDGADILFRRGRAPGFWLRKFDKGLLQATFDALVSQDWFGASFTRAANPGDSQGIIDGTLSLDLTGAAHSRAPDLYINLRGNSDFNGHGIWGTAFSDAGDYGTPQGGGTHGGMHPTELAAVLIADGAGVRPGQTVSSRTGIYDLTPTILHLLGVPAPVTMTGRVMHELFQDGEDVPATVTEEFTATAQGKVSRIQVSHVGAYPYLDQANVSFVGVEEPAPAHIATLKVAEPAA